MTFSVTLSAAAGGSLPDLVYTFFAVCFATVSQVHQVSNQSDFFLSKNENNLN